MQIDLGKRVSGLSLPGQCVDKETSAPCSGNLSVNYSSEILHRSRDERHSIKSVLRCEMSPPRSHSLVTRISGKKHSPMPKHHSLYDILREPRNYKKVLLSVGTERRKLKKVLYSPQSAAIMIQSIFRRYMVRRKTELYEMYRKVSYINFEFVIYFIYRMIEIF